VAHPLSIAFAAAIALSVTAIMLQPKRVTLPNPLNNRWPRPSDLPVFHRMRSLDVDPDEISRSEPLLLRQLEARCRDCESKDRCECDLTHNAADEMCWDWRDYCPNGPMLNMLSTLQGCHFDLRRGAHHRITSWA